MRLDGFLKFRARRCSGSRAEALPPPSLMALLVACRPCFTEPTFRTFCALGGGFLAPTGPRTVCGMLGRGAP